MTESVLPNGNMEIVFSFDTTGSMSSYLIEVRNKLQEILERLFADIPDLKVAIFAHGDYCDARSSYVTKYVDFTNNIGELCKFVTSAQQTGGGDSDECYELVLHQVRCDLNWSPNTQRALVMIGDAKAHEKNYPMNKKLIDWKEETGLLAKMGVKIYSVYCSDMTGTEEEAFYDYLAANTGGRKLRLSDISSIVQMLMAVCYRERGPEFFEAFEREVRAKKVQLTRTLSDVFDALRDGPGPSDAAPVVDVKVRTPAKTIKKTVKAKGAKRVLDFDSEDEAEPMPKRRRDSNDSSGSNSRRSSGKLAVITRSKGHIMTLRPRSKVTKVIGLKCQSRRSSGKSGKSMQKSTPKVHRETLLVKNFLPHLKWSPWCLAMQKSGIKSGWVLRENVGVKNADLFRCELDKPAMYEFAVETPGSSSRYTVYAAITKGFKNQSWENKLLNSEHIRAQIDVVLKRSCSIYIRRAECDISDLQQLRHLLATTFDYPWQLHYNSKSRTYHHRQVYKNAILISE